MGDRVYGHHVCNKSNRFREKKNSEILTSVVGGREGGRGGGEGAEE